MNDQCPTIRLPLTALVKKVCLVLKFPAIVQPADQPANWPIIEDKSLILATRNKLFSPMLYILGQTGLFQVATIELDSSMNGRLAVYGQVELLAALCPKISKTDQLF